MKCCHSTLNYSYSDTECDFKLKCGLMRISSSPAVQGTSEMPRSVKSFSVYMAGGLMVPWPMGSSLKKSQCTTSSWPSSLFSSSFKSSKCYITSQPFQLQLTAVSY